METLTDKKSKRIRHQLRQMDMATCEYVESVLVERLPSGRSYMYKIGNLELNLDQAVYEVMRRLRESTP